MRQSRLFTKTRREAPSDEVAKNAVSFLLLILLMFVVTASDIFRIVG